MQIKAEEISKIIEGQISNYESRVEMSETGTVLYVGDGIARVHGVKNAMAMELLEFPGGLMGMVLNLEEDNVGVALLGECTDIKEGDPVKRTGKIFSVPVGDAVAGRVIDPLGKPYAFAYEAHRMVRHTDRNGLSFHYHYQQAPDGDWRVDHAWGDGGLYDYRFEYLDPVRERRITDSLGHVSVVKLDENGLPINELDPLGGTTIFEYDDRGCTCAVVDPAGRSIHSFAALRIAARIWSSVQVVFWSTPIERTHWKKSRIASSSV